MLWVSPIYWSFTCTCSLLTCQVFPCIGYYITSSFLYIKANILQCNCRVSDSLRQVSRYYIFLELSGCRGSIGTHLLNILKTILRILPSSSGRIVTLLRNFYYSWYNNFHRFSGSSHHLPVVDSHPAAWNVAVLCDLALACKVETRIAVAHKQLKKKAQFLALHLVPPF